jgi:large subunit ribosomal protein L19e
MTDLGAQKRMAADILDVGKSRLWFDPDEQAEIAEAITREDIRDLIDQGTIRVDEASANSRGRARERADKRAYGHRKNAGSRKGKAGGRENKKKAWIGRIRAQRRRLRELRDDGTLTPSQYRTLYNKSSGGEFDSVDRLEAYIETNFDVTLGGDD